MRIPIRHAPGRALAIAAAILLSGPPASAETRFMGLGDLLGVGFRSRGLAVSGDGSFAAGMSEYAIPGAPQFTWEEAIRWSEGGGMHGLGALVPVAAGLGEAAGLSFDGSVAVGWSISTLGSSEAFRWTAAGGIIGLGDLAGGTFQSEARAVSGDGSVVVGEGRSASGTEAFRWTAGGGMTGLGDLAGGGFLSTATGVSADGSTAVGWSHSTSGTQAFRWTQAAGIEGLGDLPGGFFISRAWGISADGSTIVGEGRNETYTEAFRWTASEGMVGLGDLPGGGDASAAFAASADGSVVVGRAQPVSGGHAFIWDATHGMRALEQVLTDQGVDLTGWTLDIALGVSADGRTIVGYGTNPSLAEEGWIAVLDPARQPVPSLDPLGLAVLSGLLYGAVRWNGRRRISARQR